MRKNRDFFSLNWRIIAVFCVTNCWKTTGCFIMLLFTWRNRLFLLLRIEFHWHNRITFVTTKELRFLKIPGGNRAYLWESRCVLLPWWGIHWRLLCWWMLNWLRRIWKLSSHFQATIIVIIAGTAFRHQDWLTLFWIGKCKRSIFIK